MTLEEKAREYALSALKEQINLIEKVYIDGYNAARYSVNIDGVEYIDMSLPSGTLWSMPLKDKDGNPIKMTYNDASNLSIPTLEEWEEFVANTKYYKDKVKFLSKDGKEYEGVGFWIKEEPNSNHECLVIDSYWDGLELKHLFMGEKYRVVLVKRKD